MYNRLEEHLQSLIWGSLIKNEKALQNSSLETSYNHKYSKQLWAYTSSEQRKYCPLQTALLNP